MILVWVPDSAPLLALGFVAKALGDALRSGAQEALL